MYIKGMEEYLEKLKSMPDSAAVEKSKVNLEDSSIIQEDGEFTKLNFSDISFHLNENDFIYF